VPSYRKFVLLVDDDPNDLFLFKRLLEKADFRVMATTQADVAMSCIVSGEVGCLVTDQTMPISGRELVTVLREARSDISVIFLSGADVPKETLPPNAVFITKDDTQRLLDTVANCMSHHKSE
jgi:FixJ family two-component response regulator